MLTQGAIGRRRILLGLVAAGMLLLVGGLVAPNASAATFAATGSVDVHEQYVGDTGKDFTFTVSNTGTTDTIAAALISRPSSKWAITGCPQGPAGWTVTVAKTVSDTKCRYTSAAGTADDIPPAGSSSSFVVRADSVAGAADATGTWVVWVSRTGSWSSADVTQATAAGAGLLGTTARVWEITDAVVAGSAATVDTSCPPSAKQADAGTIQVIVICGKSHANTALTPTADRSTLAGTFIQSPGTFASGPVAAASASPVVLGNWTGATVTGSGGVGKTVVATLGSSATATSPVTTLAGYTASVPTAAPVLGGVEAGALAYTENDPATPVTDSLTVADSDSDLVGATVAITTGYQNGEDVLSFTNTATITGTFNAATGTLALTGTDTVANYQAALRNVMYANTSDDPSTANRTVSFQAADGVANSNVATRDIAVAAVNDAPVLAGIESTTLTFAAGDPANVVTSSITVNDADSTALASATVSISTGFQTGEDVLALPSPPAGITPSFNAATGTLTLTGSASLADYQAALRAVTFENTSGTPVAGTRTVSFTVDDGAAANNLSNTVTRNISVASVNGAPVLAGIEGTALSYTENGPAVPITNSLTVADADSSTLASATVTITTGYVNGEDVLALPSPPGGITPNFDVPTGVLTLTGSASVADYESALRAVTYASTSDTPSPSPRTVTFRVNDGAATNNLSNEVSRDITVVAANDAPVLANIEVGALTYTEHDPATAVTSTLTVADADSATLTGATVSISTGLAMAEDGLLFTNTPQITGSYSAPGGVLTLTGTATLADYEAALRSVRYINSSGNPSTATRTISFRVNDGAAANNLSNIATRDVSVTAVNDAPVLAGIEGPALTYTESAAATVVSPGITATDVDSANLVGATVQITSGYVNGEDVLSLGTNPQNGITAAAFNTTTGTLTLSGSSSVANYQAALRDVRYANSSQNPTTAARTISFQVNDGAAASNLSNIASRTVNVTRVNDAPVGVADAFDALGNTRLLVGLTGTGPRIETAGSVLTNDTDVDTPQVNLDALPATVSSANCSGCNNVVINANGSFTYDPPAGFTGNDTFTYTVRDNDTGDAPSPAQTGTGTVTITVQGPVVWYVDSTPEAGQTGNTGRSHSPFTSTTSLQPSNGSVDDANEIIFVYEGTYTAANGLALQTGQRLLGQPFGLTVDPAGSLPSQNLVAAGGTNPELRATGTSQAAISLANGVEIQRVNMSNSSAGNGCTTCTGVRGTAVTTATIGPSTQISGNSGTGFQLLTAAGGNITVGSQISGNGGLAVSVANRSGGTVQFTGQVSSTAGGVSLSSNAGATINFSAGNMNLATGTGTAFAVSGGGVVSVSGTNNALSTTTGTVVDISGASSNNITIDATITQNGATTTGRAVNVTGHTGGTVSFPKAVSSTGGAGVSLTSNASTTVTFSSAITLSGANATFVATGTGTLNASNAANVVGNTTPATGPGVRVESTTLGSTLRFTKVSVTGGTSGIVMNNTGTSFGLSVSGTGTTDASGGIIQNTTGVGVALTDTRFTTLKNMVIGDNAATAGQTPNAANNIGGDGIDMVNADDANFDNLKIARTGGHGIDGTRVTNLVLANSEILNAGDADNEHAFAFNDFSGAPPTQNNLEGTVTITNTVFDGFVQDGINVENFAGTLNMTVSGSTFANNTSALCSGLTCGETGLLARSDGSSVINLTVNGNTLFNGIDGNGLFMISEGSSATASTLNVTQTTIQNSKAIGIVLFGGTGDHTSTIPSRMDFTIGGAAGSNVSVTGSTATAISIQPNGKSTLRGKVTHVTVNGSQVGRGIEVLADDVSTSVISITNNTVSNTAFNGIFANNQDAGKMDIHIRNNNVSAPRDASPPSGLAVHGIEVNPFEQSVNCLDIAGNTSAGNAASGGAGYRTRQRDTSTFNLERYTGAANSAAQVENFLVAQNTSGTASATVNTGGGSPGYTGVADGFCADPP